MLPQLYSSCLVGYYSQTSGVPPVNVEHWIEVYTTPKMCKIQNVLPQDLPDYKLAMMHLLLLFWSSLHPVKSQFLVLLLRLYTSVVKKEICCFNSCNFGCWQLDQSWVGCSGIGWRRGLGWLWFIEWVEGWVWLVVVRVGERRGLGWL